MTKNNKHCPICDETGHTAFYCPKNPRSTIKRTAMLKARGKYHRKFEAAKRLWFKNNPPDHQGYYFCVYCGKALTKDPALIELGIELVTIDHRMSRSDAPELRYEQSNLAPCCAGCNSEKGSKSIERGTFE